MSRASHRFAVLAAVAALALLAVAPAGLSGNLARAADRGLVVIAQTRYEALPDARRVHVTVDAVATSYTPNPVDGLAYYPDASFTVQPGATNVAATSAGEPLVVDVDASDRNFLGVTVTLADGVFFEESYPYQVSYDLPDPGGAPDRNLRISPSIVAFPVWAFGTSGEAGGSVTVILPAGFRPSVQGDDLVSSTGPAGEIVLSTATLPDPFNFFAYVSADRAGAFSDTLLTVTVGDKSAALNVRSWQDDPDWGSTMSALMVDGLPALQGLIGLPYEARGTLVIEEAATSRLGEYAGVYNNLTGVIRVRYDADAYVGLHEAAHLWFNADLFRDRWIGEAFAELYGVQAALAIGATGEAFDLTDDLLASKIALNDWGDIGAVDAGVEEYAYAATYHLAQLIFARTNIAGLQAVWGGAHDEELSYQPAHGDGPPDTGVDVSLQGWQQLLDLLDERAGANFDDLWAEWVVNADQSVLMQERLVARDDYAAVVEEAGPWNLPSDLREAMSLWRFDAAEVTLALAKEVLTGRDRIAAQTDALGLNPPAALQKAFEGPNSMAQAQREAGLEIDVLTGIAKAADRLAEKESILETIGLLGSNPRASLDAARAAFEADQLDAAARDAGDAFATLMAAEDTGQTRVVAGGGGLVLVSGGVLVGIRIRRRRRATAAAAQDGPLLAAPSDMSGPPNWPMDPPA
jgi:hypothetical protein